MTYKSKSASLVNVGDAMYLVMKSDGYWQTVQLTVKKVTEEPYPDYPNHTLLHFELEGGQIKHLDAWLEPDADSDGDRVFTTKNGAKKFRKRMLRYETGGYLTKAQMKQRGWTDSLIEKLLGSPDSLKNNPSASLFFTQRVYDMENTEEFKTEKLKLA